MVLEVWHVRATGTSNTGHYVVLLDDGTHLCTCLLLINKGLICRHFFRVATYSQLATFHLTLISPRWYLEPNINQEIFLQQMPAIILCSITNSEESLPIINNTFKHLLSIRPITRNSHSIAKPNKTIYAELFGLSKKVIDLAMKANMYQELKAFLHDIQNKIKERQQTNDTNDDDVIGVNNPNITKHKGRPPKRLKSSVENSSSKGKQVLRDSTHIINITDNNEAAEGDDSGNTKGRKCGKCKQYGHYAKTCQVLI